MTSTIEITMPMNNRLSNDVGHINTFLLIFCYGLDAAFDGLARGSLGFITIASLKSIPCLSIPHEFGTIFAIQITSQSSRSAIWLFIVANRAGNARNRKQIDSNSTRVQTLRESYRCVREVVRRVFSMSAHGPVIWIIRHESSQRLCKSGLDLGGGDSYCSSERGKIFRGS